jgi:hypothetical protein
MTIGGTARPVAVSHRLIRLVTEAARYGVPPAASGAHRLQAFTTAEDEPMVIHGTTVMRLMLIVLAAMSAAGCELVGGIFKAGMWVGAIGVILLVVLLVVGVAKLKG